MPWTCYITDRRSCPLPLLEAIRRAIDAGVDYIQIREKDLCAAEQLTLARGAQELAVGSRTSLLMNDRLDVALSAGLAGIHLPVSSLPVVALRQALAGRAFSISRSTHSMTETLEAAREGADFVTLGPIFATPSKASYGEPLGLEKLAEAVRSAPLPIFALGGIHPGNLDVCLETGVAGIAAIRMFQDPKNDLAELVRKIRGSHRAGAG